MQFIPSHSQLSKFTKNLNAFFLLYLVTSLCHANLYICLRLKNTLLTMQFHLHHTSRCPSEPYERQRHRRATNPISYRPHHQKAMFQFIKKRVAKHDERKRQEQEEVVRRVRAEQEVLAMTGGSAIPGVPNNNKPPTWYQKQEADAGRETAGRKAA